MKMEVDGDKGKPFLANREGAASERSLQNEANNKNNAEEVKATLQRVVPGLNDLSFSTPSKKDTDLEIRVVQVSTNAVVVSNSAAASTSSGSSSATTSATSQRPQQQAVIAQAVAPQAVVQQQQQVFLQPQQQQQQQPRKVQYVYKQGGQTVLIDYPMTQDALAKLKQAQPTQHILKPQTSVVAGTPTPTVVISAAGVNPAGIVNVSGLQAGQKIVMAAPAPAPPVSVPTSNVDSLANSLISQITAPVSVEAANKTNGHHQTPPDSSSSNSTNSGSPVKGAAASGSSSALPKFQFAFGRGQEQQNNVEAANATATATATINGGQRLIIQSPGQQPRIVQAIASPTKIGGAAGQLVGGTRVVVPVVNVEGGGAQAVIANARNVLANQSQPQDQPQTATHADLIRQLNMARAQGLVVLQHWGDKQVLVHKATGRWIMRQGNRLVTVPPQALGIATTSQVNPGIQTTTATTSNSTSPKKPMSSSTMEQLAEFDSILESKFKSESPSPSPLPDVIQTSVPKQQQPQQQQQQPTFVIIAPTSTGAASSSSGNIVAVTSPFKSENATAKILSHSAPNSPAKVAKPAASSQSANVSPSASSFVKPPPKPQEDPDTLKRIQQILDDYNEQIRNSPDLQNRPAPRRRTNGPTSMPMTAQAAIAVSQQVTQQQQQQQQQQISPKKKRPSLGSGSPNSNSSSSGADSPQIHQGGQDFDLGSPSVIQIQNSPVGGTENPDSKVKTPTSGENKPVLRQIVVPPALAAQLQATGRQLMVITGPGGKKMIALKPLPTATGSPTSTATASTPKAPPVTNKSPVVVKATTAPSTPTKTSVQQPVISKTATTTTTTTSATPASSSSNATCSPSPPSIGSSTDERPGTPGKNIVTLLNRK